MWKETAMLYSFCDVKPKKDKFVFRSLLIHAWVVFNKIVVGGRCLSDFKSLDRLLLYQTTDYVRLNGSTERKRLYWQRKERKERICLVWSVAISQSPWNSLKMKDSGTQVSNGNVVGTISGALF